MDINATTIFKYHDNDLIPVMLRINKKDLLNLISEGKASVELVEDPSVKSDIPESKDKGNNDNLESRVSNILTQIGVPRHIKGYRYTREAIILLINDFNLINYMTKRIYPDIARMFDTTPNRVERAVRHAIESVWGWSCMKNVDEINRLFNANFIYDRKPTNSQFLALIADNLILKLKQ